MNELTDSAIMIQALEDAGRVSHIDVDAEHLEFVAKEITFFDEKKSLDLPRINRFSITGSKGSGKTAFIDASVKMYRLYYQAQTNFDAFTEHTIKEMNTQTLNHAKFNEKLVKLIEGSLYKVAPDEKEVALLIHSIKRKETFFQQNICLTTDQLATALDITDKNTARAAKKLVDANEVIGIKRNEKYVYPAFQFNRKAMTYPALKHTIPIVKERNIDNLDYCMWLSEYCSEVLHSPVNDHTYLDTSFEQMMVTAKEATAQNKVFQGKPIEAIVNGDTDTFTQLFNLWLSPETYDVHHTAGDERD
jgi:hypothetical protein